MDEKVVSEEITVINDLLDVKRRKLVQEIEDSHENLLTGIRVLIWKMGMATSKKEADDLSHEILNETIITAIEIESRFDLEKSIHAWLMGIATNKIQALRTKETRRGKRTGVVGETYQSAQQKSKPAGSSNLEPEQVSEEEMIDFLIAHNADGSPMHHKIHLNFNELVSLVDSADQLVLRLSFIDNLKGKDLAAILKTSVGAASVRLSRAIHKLRQAYLSSEASERSGE